tara:strand:- start:946 stop:1167 length:222 start_codon:yes stop_codon:yes gene_type:complete
VDKVEEDKFMIDYSKKFKIGKKVILNRNILTSNGTLYKGSEVKIDEIGYPDKDMRVTDDIGKVWYINYTDIES